MYAGAEFFRSDFSDHDYFAAKCANMMMLGTQMGWFSLVGTPVDNMGVYDLLMSPRYDAEIEYLNKLSQAKTAALKYFVHGSASRQLPRLTTGVAHDSILSVPWISADGTSLLVPITSVKRFGSFKISITFDIGKYGFAGKE